MGGEHSKHDASSSGRSNLSKANQATIDHLWEKLSDSQSQSFNRHKVHQWLLETCTSLDSSERIASFLTDHEKHGKMPSIDLQRLIALANAVVDESVESVAQLAEFVFAVCGRGKQSTEVILSNDLQEMLTEFIKVAVKCQNSELAATNANIVNGWRVFGSSEGSASRLAESLVYEANFQKGSSTATLTDAGFEIPKDAFTNWIHTKTLCLEIVRSALAAMLGLEGGHRALHLPVISIPSNMPSGQFSSILDASQVLWLRDHLLSPYTTAWNSLFSSNHQGENFSRLSGHVNGKGPTLLLVKDDCGSVFGAFASHGWMAGSQFAGDENCFVFTLSPSARVYHASGYNQNFAYLNSNQQTMPNGMGMGCLFQSGQPFCALWLDAEYGRGLSQKGGSTFNNPCLSATTGGPEFKISAMEAWCVEEPRIPPSVMSEGTSILDKDPTAKALLAMTGKGPLSEGMRESDHTAGIPGDHDIGGGGVQFGH